jgi:hypothetical protein
MKSNFRTRLESRYQIRADDDAAPSIKKDDEQKPVEKPVENPKPAEKPGASDTQTGSSHPDNWQTSLQSGKTPEEIRQDAIALADILQSWQSKILHAQDYFEELTANSDKYLHLYNPILIKGLSREKLETIARICKKFARLATIV